MDSIVWSVSCWASYNKAFAGVSMTDLPYKEFLFVFFHFTSVVLFSV